MARSRAANPLTILIGGPLRTAAGAPERPNGRRWNSGSLGGLQDELHGLDVPAPIRGFRPNRPTTSRRQPIVLRPPVVLRRPPLTVDPPLLLQPLKRRIERPLVRVEHSARELLNALADPPPVHGLEREGREDQQVERTTKDVTGRWLHARVEYWSAVSCRVPREESPLFCRKSRGERAAPMSTAR